MYYNLDVFYLFYTTNKFIDLENTCLIRINIIFQFFNHTVTSIQKIEK
jgi:hypothetical protein